MIGRAITGSGKTLAFGIPILDKIIRNQGQQRRKRIPSALVLAPTRELARQVQREFKESAPNLSSTCVYGGIPIMHQVRDLGLGMDIVVGTPGRIIDLVERGALDLSEVKFAVLDEADQMLAIGFQEAVECILSYLPSKKQCMLFSATMPSWVNELSRKYLRNPLVIDLVGDSEQKLADGISLYSVASTNHNKQSLLPTLISTYAQGGKSIIFTQTKKGAEALSKTMGSIIRSRALHGNMQQFQRDRTLAAFRSGQFSVLVATDVAARGLDIPNVDLIIHFELPNTSETFIHRSGRTGRAGNKGTAVLMFNEGQRRDVRSIERDLSCKFEELRGLTGSFVGKTDMSDDEGGSYRGYGGPAMQNPGQMNQNSERRYGNYGGSQQSRTSRYSGGGGDRFSGGGGGDRFRYSGGRGDKFSGGGGDRFSGSDRSRNNYSPRRSEPRQGGYSQTRRDQYESYDDFEDNNFSERRTDSGSSRWSSSAPTTPRRQTSRPAGMNRKAPTRSGPNDYDDLLDLFKGQY